MTRGDKKILQIKILKEDRFIKKEEGNQNWPSVCPSGDLRAGGPVLKRRPSRWFFSQGTLFHFISLHPGVKMGSGEIMLEVNPAVA